MEEAQELSHTIAIMDQGQVIARGTHAELVHIVGEMDRVNLTVTGDAAAAAQQWRDLPGVHRISPADGATDAAQEAAAGDGGPGRPVGQLSLLVEDSNRVLPRLFESAAGLGVRITSVSIQEPNLEAVFLHLTGRALRDE
jgi:ABC-2 type transport system ATP-binding protein